MTFIQSNKRIRLMGVLPSSQSQGTNMDCFTSWYPFPSAVDKPAIRLQPLNPHHHWSCWRPLGHPTPVWGSRSSTYLDLPRDLVPGSLSCLNLLGDSPIQGSQESDMPRPAQGQNSWEADLPQPAQEFDLQEAVMPQPAQGRS